MNASLTPLPPLPPHETTHMHAIYILNIPNFLTLFRLVASPLLLPLVFVHFLPFNSVTINYSLGMLFILFSLTDFFDGYLARKMHQETSLGKILDPIADKFLVYSVLVSLLAVHKIYFYWVVLLIGREFFVMGLRQLSLEHSVSVNVSFMGKVKTAFQMAYLTVAIMNPYQASGWVGVAVLWNGIEFFLLSVTLYLSIMSAIHYYNVCMKQLGALNKII